MIKVIPKSSLGRFDNEWLHSRFHFDFSGVRAPMGGRFGRLRVWNDDLIRAGTGFPEHGHRDMEIITYVRRGAISHADSLGNSGRTDAGSVQVMSAGTGIEHAEWNREDIDTELFQIWIEPNRIGLSPRWATADFPRGERAGRLVALASGEKAPASGAKDVASDVLTIHQDATLYGAELNQGARVSHRLRPGRVAYLVPAAGAVKVNGQSAASHDGVAVRDEETIEIEVTVAAELLLFDLPA